MSELKIINPFSGDLIDQVEADSAASVGKKVALAATAQKSWAKESPENRAAVIAKFCSLLEGSLEESAVIQSAETGKPVGQAQSEIRATIPRIQFFLDRFQNRLKTIDAFSDPDAGLKEEISWEPLGVIANISAWNYPYFVGTNVFVPALLVGNAVAYKPSEFAYGTGRQMVRLMLEAGLPADLMPLITGDGAVGQYLLDQDINGVFFTGSVATGRKINQAVAAKMIKVQLELGGKDPVYVADDMDPKAAAEAVGDGAFYNAGQSCCGVERIYVHESIYEPFVQALSSFAGSLKIGDPSEADTYLGPLTRKSQAAVLQSQVDDAKKKGARVLCGGSVSPSHEGTFLPTVLADVSHEMTLMREESFGPIIGVQAVKTDEAAIQLMNDTNYGLTAAVYTKEERRARALLAEIDAGTVYWNCCDRVSPHLPWSGRSDSGVGLTLSEFGIETFAQPKAWHLKRQ